MTGFAINVRPLQCLTPQLAQRLALVNQVTRVLRQHGAQVVSVDVDAIHPRLVVERADGPLFMERIGVHGLRVALREEPSIVACRAFLFGCEVDWLRSVAREK